MPEYTTYLGLEKPLQNEFYNIDVQNENMDKLDGAMGDVDRVLELLLNGGGSGGTSSGGGSSGGDTPTDLPAASDASVDEMLDDVLGPD